ncbi:protein spinster-like [Dermacentor silvarum]|uniref:protein spinster-like n=1 Tax=Dermacentor silvarum TaxID=543639 RepID=UPI002101CBAB|nr:protein spinster-like [Dermacentor silvarum]
MSSGPGTGRPGGLVALRGKGRSMHKSIVFDIGFLYLEGAIAAENEGAIAAQLCVLLWLAGVLDQVIDHYKLMNSQGGLLQTVFVITYMLTAPVFGYLGDRHSRRAIMAAGVFFWSATTLLGSIPPKKFVLFALLRGLVGIGEASYSTVAPTVIGDLFSGPRRSKMLAVFYFAIPVGSGLGYIVGASVAEALHGWYWALRVTPVLGAVAVLLVLFVLREPLRGASEGATTMGPSTLKDDLFSLIANRSYIWSTLGFTCVTFATGALAWWAPSYMTHALQLHNPDGKADEGRWTFLAVRRLRKVKVNEQAA